MEGGRTGKGANIVPCRLRGCRSRTHCRGSCTCSRSVWGASSSQGSPRQAPRSSCRQGGRQPSLLGADSRACLPSATMSGCSTRCKLGFLKFAQTIFKLISGTLSKGREPGLDPRSLSRCDLTGERVSGWQVWPFRCAQVSEEAGRNRWLGLGLADSRGPGSEQADIMLSRL